MRTLIHNCRIYADGRVVENCYLLVDAPFISDLGVDDVTVSSYDVKLNAQGRLLIPGLIDVHVHLRDQQLSYKEDFRSGTASAALGGVTSVIDMPNNLPPTDTPSRLIERINLAKERILANVGFACKPSLNHEVNIELARAGAIAFKVFVYEYMNCGTIDLYSIDNVMSSISKVNRVLMLHCNVKSSFPEALELAKKKNMAKLCRVEKKLTENVLSIAKAHGVKLHFCHVSSPKAAEVINLQRGSIHATCEATIHHLFLDYTVLEKFGSLAHVDPPLKSKFTARLLFDKLRRGVIDMVVSDHAPHALAEKCGEDPKPGFPNLQLMMPMLMTQVKRGRLTLDFVVERGSAKPAEIFGVEKRGALRKGYYADLVELDLKRRLKVKSELLVSKAKYTPFEGMTLVGVPVRTYVNGLCVNDDYTIVGRGGEGTILLPGDACGVGKASA
ncbi:MAG: dihydroorotase family protein [Candidatus Nezhaarchaeales archaeon]